MESTVERRGQVKVVVGFKSDVARHTIRRIPHVVENRRLAGCACCDECYKTAIDDMSETRRESSALQDWLLAIMGSFDLLAAHRR